MPRVNHIPIDIDNALYILLKTFGCDLNVNIQDKYDAFILGLQFAFACLIIFWALKYIFKVMSSFFGGHF